MKYHKCNTTFVLTNKVKYNKTCPHCGVGGLSIAIKQQQVKELKQLSREQYEEQRLADKVYAEFGEYVFRNCKFGD